MPLISVIVPAYNAEKTILETIESVRHQTFSDFELIVINDGSTDRTLELLDTIKDDRLKIFSYENGGNSVARNRGITHSVGEYISFIDADDLWTPEKLEMQLDALQRHPKAGVAYSWTVLIDEEGEFLFAQDPLYFEGNVYPNLLVDCFIASGSNILINRQTVESVGIFDTNLIIAADWEYYMRLASKWPFAVVPKYQVLYRLSSCSLVSAVENTEKHIFIVVDKAFEAAPPSLQHLKKECLEKVRLHLAFLYLSRSPDRNRIKRAGKMLRKSIRLHPRTLLSRKTQLHIFAWLLLQFLPPKVAQRMIRFLLKLYGRLMILVIPELQTRMIRSRM